MEENLFDDVLQGLCEAVDHVQGDQPAALVLLATCGAVFVRLTRLRKGLSRAAFAARYSFDVDELKSWELGQRFPGGVARLRLKLIDRQPPPTGRPAKPGSRGRSSRARGNDPHS